MIKYHTDAELTAFLQEKAEQGKAFVKVKGNYFYFENRPYDGRRVCALTLYRVGDEFTTEMQVREELVRLRKKGWDCLGVGKQETVKDVKRHVYLIEEIKGAELPEVNPRSEKRAQIRGKFKSLSNLLLCALYASCLYFLLSTSLIRVVTSNAYLICTAVFAVLLTICSALCLWAFADCFFVGKKTKILDVSTRLVSLVLIVFALFLCFDSFAEDKGRSERVKIGASSYKLYSDNIPVKLEDLGFDVSGPYRTSRKMQSSSSFASYTYCFDENFGVQSGENVYDVSKAKQVSYVSYTSFTSNSEFLRNIIASQNMTEGFERNEELEKLTGFERVYVSKTGRYTIENGNTVVTIKAGMPLDSEALKLFIY